jgi:serine/threonine protein phosphatase PrpC
LLIFVSCWVQTIVYGNVSCPRCGTACKVASEHLGGPVQCPKCGQAFGVRPVTGVPSRTQFGPPRLDIGSATSTGRVRDRNEDSFLVQHLTWSNRDDRHDVALLVVADGMGGHAGGDQASGLVVRTLGNAMAPLLSAALAGQYEDFPDASVKDALGYALREANRLVWQKGQNDPACKGMGATAAVVVVWDGQLRIGHVGDCRVYLHHGSQLLQITRDQTLVAKMVAQGVLTPLQAQDHPARNEVTNALGKHCDLDLTLYQGRIAAGDWLMICCDGLQAHVGDAVLQDEIAHATASATHLARRLVGLADQGGGSDNCTVVAVHAV